MAIPDDQWEELVAALRRPENSEEACSSAERVHREASLEDMPRLMHLLKDDEAFAREAAAWPISELVGIPALRELLIAYQQGLDEGLDNDGFTAALIDLVQVNPTEAMVTLQLLARDHDKSLRENALWLLQFASSGD